MAWPSLRCRVLPGGDLLEKTQAGQTLEIYILFWGFFFLFWGFLWFDLGFSGFRGGVKLRAGPGLGRMLGPPGVL